MQACSASGWTSRHAGVPLTPRRPCSRLSSHPDDADQVSGHRDPLARRRAAPAGVCTHRIELTLPCRRSIPGADAARIGVRTILSKMRPRMNESVPAPAWSSRFHAGARNAAVRCPTRTWATCSEETEMSHRLLVIVREPSISRRKATRAGGTPLARPRRGMRVMTHAGRAWRGSSEGSKDAR